MTTHKPPINLSFKIGDLHGTICTFILHTSHVLYVQVYMYILHIFIILKIIIINSKHIYIHYTCKSCMQIVWEGSRHLRKWWTVFFSVWLISWQWQFRISWNCIYWIYFKVGWLKFFQTLYDYFIISWVHWALSTYPYHLPVF